MVAIITQSVFALKKIQKPVIVTREEGKSMCLQKGSSAKRPTMPFFTKQLRFLNPHLLGKVLMVPAQLPDLCWRLEPRPLNQAFCLLYPITSLPFGKILRSSETLILCYPQNVYILKEIYPEQCVCDCWQISLWEQNNLNPSLKSTDSVLPWTSCNTVWSDRV